MKKSKNKQPSILFINKVYPPQSGATGRMLSDLTKTLSENGWKVSIISLTSDGQKSKQSLADPNITHYPVTCKGQVRSFVAIAYTLTKILLRGLLIPKHDLIVTMTDPPMLPIIGWILSRTKRMRHVHWVNDLYPDLLPVIGINLGTKTQSFLRSLSRKAMKSARAVISIGRCMTKHLKLTGIETAKIHTIQNWANTELYQDTPDLETAPTNHNTKVTADPKFRVLYAGNIGKAHAITPILNAISYCHEHHPEIEFIFVGKSPGHHFLMREREKNSWTNIRFLPHQPDRKIKKLMSNCDLHLVSMKSNASGMLVPCKFYSALAVHRPCLFIGPAESEVGQVIRKHKCGTIINRDKPKGLIDAILTYRDDPDKWFKAQIAAEKAAAIYAPDKALSKWMKILSDIHSGKM